VGQEPNEVAVPRYLVEAAIKSLRLLADTCGRRDMRDQLGEARKIIRYLDNCKKRSVPTGAFEIATETFNKHALRVWAARDREKDFRDASERLLQTFQDHDKAHKGDARFHLILLKAIG